MRFSEMDMQILGKEAIERSLRTISSAIASEYLALHTQDILKMLDPQAIANLAIADSAAGIREAIHKKMPDKIVEVVKHEDRVYQRGLFGGLTRIG